MPSVSEAMTPPGRTQAPWCSTPPRPSCAWPYFYACARFFDASSKPRAAAEFAAALALAVRACVVPLRWRLPDYKARFGSHRGGLLEALAETLCATGAAAHGAAAEVLKAILSGETAPATRLHKVGGPPAPPPEPRGPWQRAAARSEAPARVLRCLREGPSEARRVSACGVLLAICRCGADCSRSLLAARGAPALLRLLEAEGERVGGRLPDAAADTRETPVVRDCADNSDDDDGAGAPAGVRGAVRFGACVPVCAPVVCCCVCARVCMQLL